MVKRAAAVLAIAMGTVAGTLALDGEEAQACSLASLRIEDAARLADVVAVGELETDALEATLHVEGYFRGDLDQATIAIDNRRIELASDCGETPVPEPDHDSGRVVAFLRETDAGSYRGISAGRGIFRSNATHLQQDIPLEEAARETLGAPTTPESSGDPEGGSTLWIALIASAGAGALLAIVLGTRERRRNRVQR